MTASTTNQESAHARYTYRLRVSSTAGTGLEAEWARCRWIWNECVARSKKARADGEECGPTRLDKMLTDARRAMTWLREGSSVVQQQLVRDFAKSRSKALGDIKAGLPMARRAGMPRDCGAAGVVARVARGAVLGAGVPGCGGALVG